MLVLSRKEADKIYFPTLDITVEVLRIRGNKASIGIDAPTDVPVVRSELEGLKSVDFTDEDDPKAKLSELIRSTRSRLDRACVTLNRLHQQLDEEDNPVAQRLALEIFGELSRLDREAGAMLEKSSDHVARLLLLEDDANQRELLGGFLRSSGFEVATSADGQDGLDYLSMHAPPDLVLLDMAMPRCDGPTFVNSVRANDALATLKLFAVSGKDPGSLGVTTGPDGINRWFPKPIDPEQLLSIVKQELGIASAL
jgi:carbon storage regulator CsrA